MNNYAFPEIPLSLDDPIHIDRWMCRQCGLIFDFQFGLGPDEFGWNSTVPPIDRATEVYIDDQGQANYYELEFQEICSRCGCNLDEKPLAKVFISPLSNLNDLELMLHGEGIVTEFKKKFPSTADKLGREITAFANSEGGRILLGVDDDGSPVGLDGIDSPNGKDAFQQRIRGIISSIKPKIKIQVDFLSDEDINVAVITVPKGDRVYWMKDKVYIRDLDESRIAEPEEIERLIQEWSERK